MNDDLNGGATSTAPIGAGKQHDDGEQLQPAQQHARRQHQLGRIG